MIILSVGKRYIGTLLGIRSVWMNNGRNNAIVKFSVLC